MSRAGVEEWWPAFVLVAVVVMLALVRRTRRLIGGLARTSWQACVSFRGRAGRWSARHARIIRRLTAAAFFVAALVLTLISNFTPHLQACAEQIARVGTTPSVRTCDPMSIDTAPILILFIAAGVLLLPEWSVFEIPGVLRLEKQVREQAQRQEEILHLLQSITVSQNQNLTVGIMQSLDELDDNFELFMLRRRPGREQ